jgi:hypothetical protein
MIVTIDGINRKPVTTKYGTTESIGILPIEETLTDINGDDFAREGRWLSGFKDKMGVTDSWKKGDKIKVNLVRKAGKKADGSATEYINFRLPEGTAPVVQEVVPVEDTIDADPDGF